MSQDDNQDNVTNSNEQSNSSPVRPVVSFSGSGGLNVAVWKQKGESEFEHYSVLSIANKNEPFSQGGWGSVANSVAVG